MIRRPPTSTRTDTLFPYTTLFRSNAPSEPAISCTYADLKYPVYTIRVTRYQPGDKGERPPSRRRIRDTSRIIRCPPDSAGGWTQPCLRHFASQYHRGTVHPSPSERSKERREGKECVSPCRSRWSR